MHGLGLVPREDGVDDGGRHVASALSSLYNYSRDLAAAVLQPPLRLLNVDKANGCRHYATGLCGAPTDMLGELDKRCRRVTKGVKRIGMLLHGQLYPCLRAGDVALCGHHRYARIVEVALYLYPQLIDHCLADTACHHAHIGNHHRRPTRKELFMQRRDNPIGEVKHLGNAEVGRGMDAVQRCPQVL